MAEIVGEVDEKIKKINGMREARQRKRNKKLQQRERLRGRRLKEKQEAEKAYDPGEFRSYEMSWNEEEEAIKMKEDEEDAADEDKAAEQDLKWDTEEERLVDMRENLGKEIERLRTRPRGEKFVKRSKHELQAASGGLQNAKNAMATAERDVRLSRETESAKPGSKMRKCTSNSCLLQKENCKS